MAEKTKATETADEAAEATMTPEQRLERAQARTGVLHQAHADYIRDQYGVDIDPLHIFLGYSTRKKFRETDEYRQGVVAAKEEEAERRKAEKAEASEALKAEREKARAEKAAEREAAKAAKAEKAAQAEAAKAAAKAEKESGGTAETAPTEKKRGRKAAKADEKKAEKAPF